MFVNKTFLGDSMVQLLLQLIKIIVLCTLQQHLLKSKVKHWLNINQSAKTTVVRSSVLHPCLHVSC